MCSFICPRSLNPSKVAFKIVCLRHGSLIDCLDSGKLDLSVVLRVGQAWKPSKWKRNIQVGFGVTYVWYRKTLCVREACKELEEHLGLESCGTSKAHRGDVHTGSRVVGSGPVF